LTQSQLSAVAARINEIAVDMDASDLEEIELDAGSPVLLEIFQLVLGTMRSSEVVSSGEVFRDGFANMLSEPEFSEPEKARKTLELFEDRSILDDLLSRTAKGAGFMSSSAERIPGKSWRILH
jgi:transcriptional regulator of heat shock response